MMAPVHGRAREGRGLFVRIALGLGFLALIVASYFTASSGAGILFIGAFAGVLGVTVVVRRPVLGVLVLMTTFLFTYPAFLRGIGNLTINNVLGLLLLPMMFYEMLRDHNWWVFRFKPFILITIVAVCIITSGSFYSGASEYVEAKAEAKIEASQRAQGPALISTRDAAAKYVTRLVFLVLFVFFIRTSRDLEWVVLILITALLFTYFSVSTGAGDNGWGTGRLRSLSDAGGAVYAGRNPNKLAYFAQMVLTLVWYGRRAIRQNFLYLPWAAISAVTFVMIPMTGSRSGMLNLLIFMLMVLMEGRFNYRKVVGLAAVTFVVVVQFSYQTSVLDLLLPADTAARLEKLNVRTEVIEDEGTDATGSAGGRFRTAEAATRAWLAYPVFGVGIGNFESERAATDPFGVVGPPHNSYLWALAEGGLVTFVLYLWLFSWTILKLHGIQWEYEARFGPMKLHWLVSGMRTLLFGFLFFSIFADMWYHDFFYIIMGLSLVLIRIHERYAETGVVPTSFSIGGSSATTAAAPVRVARPRAAVIAPQTFLRP